MLKVVWICPLNLYPYREKLDIESYKFKGLHPASWITALIEEMENRRDIEVYVISASSLIKKTLYFKNKNVNYYILKKRKNIFPNNNQLKKENFFFIYLLVRIFLFIPKRLYNLLAYTELYSNYWIFRKKVVRIINNIQPDIINSHGTEYIWSLPLLDIDYPSVVTIQGFINRVVMTKKILETRKRTILENRILREKENFIVRTIFMNKLILKQNPNANVYFVNYPLSRELFKLSKKYLKVDSDIVFAGGIAKAKGVEDLIAALRIIIRIKPDISVKILGMEPDPRYIQFLKKIIRDFGLQDNVRFLGYIEKYIDLLEEIKKSKIFVLPTYRDTQPGTVLESMAMGVPVISYNVDGLPDMIENGISGILVDKGDINILASEIVRLLKDSNLREKYSKKARKFIEENWEPESIINKLIGVYKEVMLNHKKEYL